MKFRATIETTLVNIKGEKGVMINGRFIEFNDYIAGLNALGMRSWEVNYNLADNQQGSNIVPQPVPEIPNTVI